jgi:DNA-binding NarL/FixJ family response regulator
VPVVLESMGELVDFGLRGLLAPYADRIILLGASVAGDEAVIHLIDPYHDDPRLDPARLLRRLETMELIVFLKWGPVVESPQMATIERALHGRLRGWLSMNLAVSELVATLERIYLGEVVGGDREPRVELPRENVSRLNELTEREQGVLILITAGLSNREITEQACLTINTVKSYIRSSYRKIGVTTRSQAVLWGVAHGLALSRGPNRATSLGNALPPEGSPRTGLTPNPGTSPAPASTGTQQNHRAGASQARASRRRPPNLGTAAVGGTH